MRKTLKRVPTLRLTPYAWAKLLRLRDLGETEVGGFGISANSDLLLIEDVCLVRQTCTAVSVKFQDESVADYFDVQVDRGLPPERFARIWIHTHPGDSPHPSHTDEETFARCFGSADWAVMFILARGGQTYARLRFRAGPGGELVLPVEIDFDQPFAAADFAAWDAEYDQSVTAEVPVPITRLRDQLLRDPPGPAHDPFLAEQFWDDMPPHPSLEILDDRFDRPLYEADVFGAW